MKKRYIAMIVVGLLAGSVIGIWLYERMHVEFHREENGQSVSVIGGADGPTAVFVAGKLGGKEKQESWDDSTETENSVDPADQEDVE